MMVEDVITMLDAHGCHWSAWLHHMGWLIHCYCCVHNIPTSPELPDSLNTCFPHQHTFTPHTPHPTPVPVPTRHVCFFTVASSRADLLSYNVIVNKVIYAWLDRSPCLPVNTFTKQTESTGMVTKNKATS